MLRLLPEAMDQLFQPTLDAIVKAIREVISQPDVAGLNRFWSSGWFIWDNGGFWACVLAKNG